MKAQNELAGQREKWQGKIDLIQFKIKQSSGDVHQWKVLARFQMQQQIDLHHHEQMNMQNYIKQLEAKRETEAAELKDTLRKEQRVDGGEEQRARNLTKKWLDKCVRTVRQLTNSFRI